MAFYAIKSTKEFEKHFKKLSLQTRVAFEKQFRKLTVDPYSLGKPLGYNWFRELKYEKYRVYYLVYTTEIIVLLIGVSDKKSQSQKIRFIKANIHNYKDLIKL